MPYHVVSKICSVSSYEVFSDFTVRIMEYFDPEEEFPEWTKETSEMDDTVIIDLVDKDMHRKESSDSGLGRSNNYSEITENNRRYSTICPSVNEVRESLCHEFCQLILSSENEIPLFFLWPSTSRFETWILSKMSTSISPEEKLAFDEFLADLLLFAVRSGPASLVSALLALGTLHSGEQLSNNFSALQTSAIWSNHDVLVELGCSDPVSAIETFRQTIDVEYCRIISPLDAVVLSSSTDLATGLRPFYHGTMFNLQTLSVLFKLKNTPHEGIPNSVWNDLLLAAAEHGHIVYCHILLHIFKVNIDARHPILGRTPLHYAALNGHLSLFKLFIRYGANPNTTTPEKELPEELCNRHFCEQFKHALLDARLKRLHNLKFQLLNGSIDNSITAADLVMEADSGESLLSMIVTQCDGQLLQQLLDSVPDVPLNMQNSHTGRSFLINSVLAKNLPVVKVLMGHGICPSLRDFTGNAALDYVVDQDDVDMLKELLSFQSCWTGLFHAAKRTKSVEASSLLQSVIQKRQHEIVKPALLAAAVGDVDKVSILEHGDVVKFVNNRGESPAYLAAKHGLLDVFQVIMEYGGDLLSRHKNSYNTTLHVAARGGHSSIIKFIAEYACRNKQSVDLDDFNRMGNTPACLAAQGGHAETLRVLFELGASSAGYFRDGLLLRSSLESVQAVLDAYQLPRQVAIFRAIEKGDLKTLRSVWMSKFDHYFRNHIGDTPLMIAAQTGDQKILGLLLETAEQPCRPFEPDAQIAHDKNVEQLLANRRSQSPKEADNFVSIDHFFQVDSRRKQTAFQWIFGNSETQISDCVLTIFVNEYLINHTSAINVVDGCCAVHRCIEVGDNVDTVRKLVNKDPFCVNIQEHNGFTPLHLAVILQRRNIVRYLIQLDCIDLYATDLLGRMPEELVQDEQTLQLIKNASTTRPNSWITMCDALIPLSTADGLSDWTRQFQNVGSVYSDDGSHVALSIFAGKTSASQDGVFEYFDRKIAAKSRQEVNDSCGSYDGYRYAAPVNIYSTFDYSLPRIGIF